MDTTKINWDEIKNKVALLQKTITQRTIMLPEEKSALLKKRAQELAKENKNETIQSEFIEIIEFSLASEEYGIETEFVREVYPLKDYTILPGVPDFVLGVINVRGQIISVIDLKKFFNLQEKGLGELNKVIIIQNEHIEFGILADIIHGTHSVSIDTIQDTLQKTNVISSNYLKGVTNKHLIIFDAQKILEDKKIILSQDSK